METPFFFPNGNYSLFGVLHRPEQQSTLPAFVFCHALCEEKLWSHRVYVAFARLLAAAGHPVLRFDYMGNGDSDGSFSDATLDTILSDAHAAVREVTQRTAAPAVSLLGLRFGGMVASLVAEQLERVDRLVLWSPIVDGARYTQELLRINLTTQMAVYREIRRDREALVAALQAGESVNVDGYEMALPLYEQVSQIRLASAPKRCSAPCLITQIDRQAGRTAPDLAELSTRYQNVTLNLVQEEPFWKEIARFYDQAPLLFADTRRWMDTAPLGAVVALPS